MLRDMGVRGRYANAINVYEFKKYIYSIKCWLEKNGKTTYIRYIYTNEYLFAILQGRAKTTRLTRIYGTTFRIISTTNNKIFGYSLPIV